MWGRRRTAPGRDAKRPALVALSVGLLAACSVLTSYDGLVGGGPGGPSDASGPASGDAEAATWTLTALGPDDDAGCPAGFGSPERVLEGLDAGAASCSCSCAVTTPPSCGAGMVAATIGINACNLGPFSIKITGMCTTVSSELSSLPFPAGTEVAVAPLGPSGGACSAKAALDPGSVSFTKTSTACSGSRCPGDGGACEAPALPPGFVACISTPGESACPSTPPFTTRHLVGATVDVSCGGATDAGAGCGCVMEAGCPATMGELFTDTTCSEGGLPIVIDGMCHPVVGAASETFKSFFYEAGAPANVACTPVPDSPGPATATLQGLETLCCTK